MRIKIHINDFKGVIVMYRRSSETIYYIVNIVNNKKQFLPQEIKAYVFNHNYTLYSTVNILNYFNLE